MFQVGIHFPQKMVNCQVDKCNDEWVKHRIQDTGKLNSSKPKYEFEYKTFCYYDVNLYNLLD